MNDIRNVARVGYSDDGAEATGLKRGNPNTGIMDDSQA